MREINSHTSMLRESWRESTLILAEFAALGIVFSDKYKCCDLLKKPSKSDMIENLGLFEDQ